MSVFSFGLLLPIPTKLDLRFVPQINIYDEPVDDEDMTTMARMWIVLD
jgi:hypothetical protein